MRPSADTLSIGKVAQAAGVGVETVRYYQRCGLIDKPPRRKSGFRQYPPDTVDRLRFIRRAKNLGFTLRQIGELLEMRVDPGATCGDVRRRAETKIADIDRRIADLRRMKSALKALAAECEGDGPLRICPIVGALERGSEP